MDTQQKRLLDCYLKNINPVFRTFFLGPFVLFPWDETNQSRRCNMGLFSPQTGKHSSFSTASQGLRKDNLVTVNLPGSPVTSGEGKQKLGNQMLVWAGVCCRIPAPPAPAAEHSAPLLQYTDPCSAGPLCCTRNQVKLLQPPWFVNPSALGAVWVKQWVQSLPGHTG